MTDRRRLHEAIPVDQVARWTALLGEYPEARYATDAGWFYGALRDADDVVRESSLERMINRLLAREREVGTA